MDARARAILISCRRALTCWLSAELMSTSFRMSSRAFVSCWHASSLSSLSSNSWCAIISSRLGIPCSNPSSSMSATAPPFYNAVFVYSIIRKEIGRAQAAVSSIALDFPRRAPSSPRHACGLKVLDIPHACSSVRRALSLGCIAEGGGAQFCKTLRAVLIAGRCPGDG